MLAAASIILFGVALFCVKIPFLRKRKLNKDAWIFFCFLLAGTVFGVMYALQMRMLSPLGWISVVFKWLSNS